MSVETMTNEGNESTRTSFDRVIHVRVDDLFHPRVRSLSLEDNIDCWMLIRTRRARVLSLLTQHTHEVLPPLHLLL